MQELQELNSFPRTDSNKTLLCLGLIEYSRTVRFSRKALLDQPIRWVLHRPVELAPFIRTWEAQVIGAGAY